MSKTVRQSAAIIRTAAGRTVGAVEGDSFKKNVQASSSPSHSSAVRDDD